MMRVLHVISGIDPRLGGPVAAVVGFATGQRREGMEVELISTWQEHRQDRHLVEAMRAVGVEVHLAGPARGPLVRHPQIEPLLRKTIADVDVIHIHGLWEEIQHRAARVAQKSEKPYIIRTCGMLDPWSMAKSRWRKRLYLLWRLRRNLDRAAAVHFTTAMERDLTAWLAIKAPTVVEPLGINMSEFDPPPERGAFRSLHQSVGNRPLLAFMGRIHPGKGLERLIPALASLDSQVMLVVIGPDSAGHQRRIEALVREHRVVDRVIFAGMLRGEWRNAALADADLFVLPSDHENFGMVVVEALACGTPVIVSDQVALHGDVAAAEVGAVVPNDVAALTRELARWLGDSPMREAAASRAARFARDRFDWPAIVSRWAHHYARMASREGDVVPCR